MGAGAHLLLLVPATAAADLPTPTRGKNTTRPRRRPSTPFSVNMCASRGGCLGVVARTRARKHAHTRAGTHARNQSTLAQHTRAQHTHTQRTQHVRTHLRALTHTYTHARAHTHLRVGGISHPPIRVHGAARAASPTRQHAYAAHTAPCMALCVLCSAAYDAPWATAAAWRLSPRATACSAACNAFSVSGPPRSLCSVNETENAELQTRVHCESAGWRARSGRRVPHAA